MRHKIVPLLQQIRQ